MTTQHKTSTNGNRWISVVIGIAGVGYTLIGLALILTPQWFFDNVGPFAPFNRHYEGDLGTFILPMGLGLLFAMREPAQHHLFLAVAAGASLLHAANHLYEALTGSTPPDRVVQDTAPLISLGLLLLTSWWGTRSVLPNAH
jgi:hypothetical protein